MLFHQHSHPFPTVDKRENPPRHFHHFYCTNLLLGPFTHPRRLAAPEAATAIFALMDVIDILSLYVCLSFSFFLLPPL